VSAPNRLFRASLDVVLECVHESPDAQKPAHDGSAIIIESVYLLVDDVWHIQRRSEYLYRLDHLHILFCDGLQLAPDLGLYKAIEFPQMGGLVCALFVGEWTNRHIERNGHPVVSREAVGGDQPERMVLR
jgi:hypothetical protein